MKRIAAFFLCILMLCAACCVLAEDFPCFAVVSNPDPADRLNLRTHPSTQAISLGKFYNGTPVTVIKKQGEWAYVSLYKDFEGWMHTDYLAFVEDTLNAPCAMPTVTITAPMGKTVCDTMMEQPAVSASFVMGSRLEVMGVMEDWLFVRSGSIVGFTENSGTTPRVYFSSPDITPPARVSIIATPTPSPTPVPLAAQEYSLVAVPVEGARNVTKDDWIIFAALKETTLLFADRALKQPIDVLHQGYFTRVFNDISSYAVVVTDNRIAGYIPATSFSLHAAQWPFYINQPSAEVANPIPSDRLHLRISPDKEARSLGRYYNGTIVTLLDNFSGRNEWTHVDVCGVSGYMKSEYLDFSPSIGEDITALHLLEVNNPITGDLHLRHAPDTSSESLGLYKNGTLVAVIGVTGDWAHVICDGQTGYMLYKHLFTSIGTPFDPY